MSPLSRQSTLFLQSEPTEDFDSRPFWSDGAISSSFLEETFRLFEGADTPVEGSPAAPTGYLLPLFDGDHLGPPSASSEDSNRVNLMGFTSDASTISFTIRPDDLFDPIYQASYIDFLQNDCETCVPAQTMSIFEVSPPALALCDDSVTSITETLSSTHFSPAPVDPSAMTAYGPYFDHGYNSRAPSTPRNASIASPPPTSSPASSPRFDSSESDGEGDTDYVPPSDDDEEYRPTQATSSQKQKKPKVTCRSKSRRAPFSPARSTSSESEKSANSSRAHRRSHPYKCRIPSRNFQREDGAERIDRKSDFQCPVAGCDHTQKNQRIPDLKRHILTHDRWMEPEKWICCGVSMDIAHLYARGIEEGMTEEEQIKAGAYMFRGQLRIGGCLKTFARRDALKRHIDNRNLPCIGHMNSYLY